MIRGGILPSELMYLDYPDVLSVSFYSFIDFAVQILCYIIHFKYTRRRVAQWTSALVLGSGGPTGSNPTAVSMSLCP